jgi:hypothetical protein
MLKSVKYCIQGILKSCTTSNKIDNADGEPIASNQQQVRYDVAMPYTAVRDNPKSLQ